MTHDDALPARLSDADILTTVHPLGRALPAHEVVAIARAVEQRVRAALAARAEPVAYLYQHDETARTTIRTADDRMTDEYVRLGRWSEMPLYLAAPPALPQDADVECETCEGRGTLDERLGGYGYRNPAAKCPDCDGAGWWRRKAAPPALQQDAARAEPVAWRDHVEQRIRSWRQSNMNRSGDRLAIDDFMGENDIDDLVDYVCDEWAEPAAPPALPPGAREAIDILRKLLTHWWAEECQECAIGHSPAWAQAKALVARVDAQREGK
jgi:hypothetical protein